MSSYINLPDITVTSGSDQVSINSTESVSGFREGDLLFVNGQDLPLVILAASNNIITLAEVAAFTAANAVGMLIKSNIAMADALTAIKANNAAWSLHFSPFINWISTSEMQTELYDTLGNAITVYSAQGLNQLATDIQDASSELDAIEDRVTQAESDLTTIEDTLDGKITLADQAVTDAQAEVVNASDQVTLAANEVVNAAEQVALAEQEVAKATTQASLAYDSANQAMSSSNYIGYWNVMPDGVTPRTGGLSVPATARDGSGVYMLDADIPDITQSQPSANLDKWFLVGSIGGDATNSERLGGELPSYYATKAEVDEALLLSLGVR